jgi:excisionase family DNA binding protein
MEGSPGLPDHWVTIADAADRFGVHQHTVNNWIRAGKLPVVELSRRRRYVDWQQLSTEMATLARDRAAGRQGERRQPDSAGGPMRTAPPDDPSGG